MRNENILIARTPAGDARQQTETSNSETDGIRETLAQTQHDAIRMRQQLDRHIENSASISRRVYILCVTVILVALSLVGLSWYFYSDLSRSHPILTAVPGLQKVADMMGDRVTAVEGGLKRWTGDRASLTDRMAKLETSMGSNLKTARTQAQAIAKDMGLRIRQEVSQDLHAVQNRIAGVESVQRETQEHVSRLQGEIGSLRQEVASLQQQNAQQLTQQLTELKQASKVDMDRINTEMSTQSKKLTALNDQVDRQRLTFTVADNQTHQVAPGIYLTVKHSDVKRQQVDGWMQLTAEGRILWIRGLSAQESFPFSTRADTRTQALVFTNIGPTGVSGYLLVPRPSETTSAADTSSR